MNSLKQLLPPFVALGAMIVAAPAGAVEVLVNGNFEASAAPTSWTATASVVGQPGLGINATEQVSFADQTGTGLGVFLRPFAGNVGDYNGLNYQFNYNLSQTVNAFAGRTYTFTGASRFGGDGDPLTNDGYSGGVNFLLPGSASDPGGTGTVPSPTSTAFKIEFLNTSNAVIGSSLVDLKADGQVNDSTWRTNSVALLSPAGTRFARVSVDAQNIVDNNSFQDVFFDDFSLRDSSNPTTERLLNGNLNTLGPPFGYEITSIPTNPTSTESLIGYRDFANYTTGGQQGVWLRSFAGGDAFVSQTATAVPGGDYTFSAFSRWEPGYAGQLPGTETTISLEFRDASNNIIGTAASLNLRNAGQLPDNQWREYSVSATAPANAASVRVVAGATGMYNTGFDPQSAFFDDFSLQLATTAAQAGDFNGDGRVDSGDLSLLLANWGGPVPPNPSGWTGFAPTAPGIDSDELSALLGNWGFGASTAVPEPTAALLALAGAAAFAGRRRN